MRDGQYRLLWTGISDSKKMKAVKGGKVFRLGCHLVYTWLLPWCDDDGRMPGEPLKILANVVPNEEFNLKEIEEFLTELTRVKLIIWYEVENEKFIQILNWEEHQRIRKDRYNSSIYPQCQPSGNQLTTSSPQKCDPSLSLSLSLSPSLSPSLSRPSGNQLTTKNDFENFWKEYPKKKNRGDAEKAWKKIKPNQELFLKILQKIEEGKSSEDWLKDNGKFIPYPASWLNAKGWEDEYKPAPPFKPQPGITAFYKEQKQKGEAK